MPVASGQMRHRLTLYAPEGTRGAGSPDELATDIPARIEAVPLQFQQQERIAAGGLRGQTLYTVTIRYRDDVREDLQLIEECCTERTFHILSMIPDDTLQWLELTCVVGPTAAA
jgi:head-tail adaptor